MNYQIKITGTGTPEEIATALRTIADAIHHPTSMGHGMNMSIDNVTWEDSVLCTEITQLSEQEPDTEPPTDIDVQFFMETGNGTDNPTPLAVFVHTKYNDQIDSVVCYAHVGGHSQCSPSYFHDLPKATPEQYEGLKSELEQIGYVLNVI